MDGSVFVCVCVLKLLTAHSPVETKNKILPTTHLLSTHLHAVKFFRQLPPGRRFLTLRGASPFLLSAVLESRANSAWSGLMAPTAGLVGCRLSDAETVVRYLPGGSRVKPLQVSGGISILQSRASGLQSTTRGSPSGPKRTPPSQTKNKENQAPGEVSRPTEVAGTPLPQLRGLQWVA